MGGQGWCSIGVNEYKIIIQAAKHQAVNVSVIIKILFSSQTLHWSWAPI